MMDTQALFEHNRSGVIKAWGKTERYLKKCTDSLSEWLKKQPHLPEMEEWKLEIMVINSKFSCEKAKKRIDLYYSIRNFQPELYSNWDPDSEDLTQAVKRLSFIILPKLNKDLEQVGIGKVHDPNTDNFAPATYLKLALMCTEMQLKYFYCMGQHMIYDMEGVHMGHLVKFTPSFLQTAKLICIKIYPYQFKGIHFINADSKLDIMLAVLKQILKPKIFNKIHVHESLESLYKLVPRELLPEDYGGSEPPFQELHDKWVAEATKHKTWFEKELASKSNEDERIGPSVEEEIYGSTVGSFRRLSLD